MRINKISLENFRCFEHKEIEFLENFTVLIGNNATGKTTVLDALAIALDILLFTFNNNTSRDIKFDDIRLKSINIGSVVTLEPQYPTKIIGNVSLDGISYEWIKELNEMKVKERGTITGLTYAKQTEEHILKIKAGVREGNKEVVLPITSYYGTGRLWQQERKNEKSLPKLGSRFLGYTDCLNPASNEKLMIEWFRKMTLIKLEEEKEPDELTAVRNVLKYCLRNIDDKELSEDDVDIFYSVKSDELEIKIGNRERLPFRMLSDGYRNTLGMIADIAYRMAVLNPQFLDKVTSETPGVVLIDEIDLHLHPKWQRHIVNDLKHIFPKVQFIVTTHSPFIIQSLDVGELKVLDIADTGEYVNASIEDIIENVMGIEIPQWSERRRKMYEAAEKYFVALNKMDGASEEELERLRSDLDKYSKPFADNLAYYAFLEQKRLLKEMDIERGQSGETSGQGECPKNL